MSEIPTQNTLQVEVVDPGHAYRLPSFDGELFQTLTFMKREGEGFPGNVGHYPGTNLQSVLRACFDRVVYLQRQIPHENNIAIMCHLRHCLRELEQRAAERHGYNVNLITLDLASSGAMCVVCGHVLCGHSVIERGSSHVSGVSSDKPLCANCGHEYKEHRFISTTSAVNDACALVGCSCQKWCSASPALPVSEEPKNFGKKDAG